MAIGKVKNTRNNYFYKVAIKNPLNGKKAWKYKSGFATKSEAVLAQAKFIEDYVPEIGTKTKNIMTFKDLYDEYMDYRRKQIRQSTFDSIKYRMKKHILDPFEKIKISQFNRALFLNWRRELEKQDTLAKYKNTILNEFKMIAAYADRTHGINFSYIISEPTFRSDMTEVHKKVLIYTEEDFKKLYDATDDLMWKTFFTVLFYSGLRLGEIRALKWDDYKGSHIQVNKALYTRNKDVNAKNRYTTPVKTKSSVRNIQLPKNSLVVDTINEWLRRSKEVTIFDNDWYIFGDDKYLTETTIRRKLKYYVSLAGIDYIHPHAFRHSYTTVLFNRNVNPKITQSQLGHSSISVTLDTYTKLSNKQIGDAINDAFNDDEDIST